MIIAALLVSAVPFAGLLPGAEVTGKVCSAYSFEMDQDLSNSGGVVNRFIGISDPWSGGYLYEDLTVIGSASITDSFSMDNFGSGASEDIFDFGNIDNSRSILRKYSHITDFQHDFLLFHRNRRRSQSSENSSPVRILAEESGFN